MRKGFTLIELLIVIVIIGILATLAVPNYTKMVEKAKADQAVSYLRVIRTGEKIYYAGGGAYVACANRNQLKSNLGAEVTEENYLFSVTVTSPSATQFLATAKHNGNNTTITLDYDGMWGGTSPYKPAN